MDSCASRAALPKMFGPELMQAFVEFKALWDPTNRMNPGKLIDPIAVYEPTENLRIGAGYEAAADHSTWFQYPGDKGSFGEADRALRRRWRVSQAMDHGTMCPSYMATREGKALDPRTCPPAMEN